MKNSSIYFLVLLLSLWSCSENDSDSDIRINPIEVNQITASNKYAFIEDEIFIEIDASGYSVIEVTSEDNVTIEKIDTTTYQITASESTEASIEVQIVSGEFNEIQTLDIEFVEHGVIDFEIVEGIHINNDTTDKIIELFGEPDYTYSNSTNTEERWDYAGLGIRFEITIATGIVDEVRLYATDFDRVFNDESYLSGIYTYEISEDTKIENLQLTASDVINKYGDNYTHKTSSSVDNLHYFDYTDMDVVFFYFSDDIEDYSDQEIPYITIY